MHVGGEEDTRAVYCACIIAAYLDFDFKSDLFTDTVNYLTSCQSWDGGFGPNPGKFGFSNFDSEPLRVPVSRHLSRIA